MTLGARLPSIAPVAAVAAAAVFLTSAGDASVGAVLLLVALGPVAGAASLGALVAMVARWGTSDLSVVAGDQAVLGAAIAVGPVAAALSSGLAAVALLLVARPVVLDASSDADALARDDASARRLDGWLHHPRAGTLLGALPCGLAAAALAAGPATTSAVDLAVRAVASVLGVGLAAMVASRRPDDERLDLLAMGIGAVAAVLAVVA